MAVAGTTLCKGSLLVAHDEIESVQPTDEAVARYWDANANLWTEQVRRGWDAYREHFNNPAFFAFLGEVKGKRVLDAGCGEGYNTRILARTGAEVVGVDVSARLIEHARQAESQQPLGIRYEVASFSDLTGVFQDQTFDLVVSFMALMDGPDYESACRELLRVLRPGGELVFSLTHPCFMTPGFGWLRDEETEPDGLTVAHYFDTRPRLEHWRFSKGPIPQETPKFEVPRFPRTLSQYINGLIEAGLILRRLEEPRPSEAACREHPWLRRWRDHASLFIYFRTQRPTG